jgi:hypothetical protein
MHKALPWTWFTGSGVHDISDRLHFMEGPRRRQGLGKPQPLPAMGCLLGCSMPGCSLTVGSTTECAGYWLLEVSAQGPGELTCHTMLHSAKYPSDVMSCRLAMLSMFPWLAFAGCGGHLSHLKGSGCERSFHKRRVAFGLQQVAVSCVFLSLVGTCVYSGDSGDVVLVSLVSEPLKMLQWVLICRLTVLSQAQLWPSG